MLGSSDWIDPLVFPAPVVLYPVPTSSPSVVSSEVATGSPTVIPTIPLTVNPTILGLYGALSNSIPGASISASSS